LEIKKLLVRNAHTRAAEVHLIHSSAKIEPLLYQRKIQNSQISQWFDREQNFDLYAQNNPIGLFRNILAKIKKIKTVTFR